MCRVGALNERMAPSPHPLRCPVVRRPLAAAAHLQCYVQGVNEDGAEG